MRPASDKPGIWLSRRWSKPVLALACALPAVWLLWAGFSGRLGANPAEALIRGLGDWTLRFLCLTLAVTPVRVVLGMPVLARFRRMLGLWVFAYASLHLLSYGWLDMGLEWSDIGQDVIRRPFIAVGVISWMLLLALAVTSSNRVVKAMGAARWQILHRAVYGIALLALLHFYWMRAGKNDFAEVGVYAVLIAGLLGWRIRRRWRRQALR